jgi:3-methyladenine DNA glycosylase/8-oxoguanine DNA glycosylase
MPLEPPAGWRLLVEDRRPCTHDLGLTIPVDALPWGAVARRDITGGYWRALSRPQGDLLLHAARSAGGAVLAAWAPPGSVWTPDAAVEPLGAWAGFADAAEGADELLAADPRTRRLTAALGPVRLSRMPDVQEAIGRGVIGQLVQFEEARRSCAQLVRLAGPAVGPLRAWPGAMTLLSVPDWDLRRHCGMSLRGVRALRAAAGDERRLGEAAEAADWARLDARLRAIPGIGVWTSAEARLALGDADAVPFGDWHLPSLVGHALAGPAEEPAGGWTDTELEALLEPFRPHRGRVIRALMHGAIRGMSPRPARRAPRSALSTHRYW